jgi:hypothetical protein
MAISTLMLSSSADLAVEVRSQSAGPLQACEKWTVTDQARAVPCSGKADPCYRLSNSLF